MKDQPEARKTEPWNIIKSHNWRSITISAKGGNETQKKRDTWGEEKKGVWTITPGDRKDLWISNIGEPRGARERKRGKEGLKGRDN